MNPDPFNKMDYQMLSGKTNICNIKRHFTAITDSNGMLFILNLFDKQYGTSLMVQFRNPSRLE